MKVILFSSQNEFQSINHEERKIVGEIRDDQNRREEPILFETLAINLNENQKEILRQKYDQQGNRLILFPYNN